MTRTIDVGILGATGTVGQQIVALLCRHPWFRLRWVAASERSIGRPYRDLPWRLSEPLPEAASRLVVEEPDPGRAPALVFSALDASVAGSVETAFARSGRFVVSNARNHRLDPAVPLVVPEINAAHLGLISAQRRACDWPGAIVTNPNCSTVFLSMALAALRRFGLERVIVTTLQALSGAGHPGVASLDALGNVIPFIAGEEEKIETETGKILGSVAAGRVEPHPVRISAQATRVPVAYGHTEMVAVSLAEQPPIGEVRRAFAEFPGVPERLELPSAPPRPLVCHEAPDRPQPALDVARNAGMSVHIGRVRACPVLGCKFVALGHNTIRGAAGAAVLNAELMAAEGLID